MHKVEQITQDGEADWKIWDENLGEAAFSLIAESREEAIAKYHAATCGGIATDDSIAYFKAWEAQYGKYLVRNPALSQN